MECWTVSYCRNLFSGPVILTVRRNTARRYAHETEGGTGNLKTPDDRRATFQQPSRFPFSESRYKPCWRQMLGSDSESE
ncbi:translation initiation factor IF-2-like [Prionailurus iriomotensis]